MSSLVAGRVGFAAQGKGGTSAAASPCTGRDSRGKAPTRIGAALAPHRQGAAASERTANADSNERAYLCRCTLYRTCRACTLRVRIRAAPPLDVGVGRLFGWAVLPLIEP